MWVPKKLGIFAVATVVLVFAAVWFWGAHGFRGPIFAFLLNLFAMCWVGAVNPAVYLIFPESYYAVKDFERTGRIYERLGIRPFKKLVYRGPLRVLSPALRLPKPSEGFDVRALRRLDLETRKSEAAHVLIFVLVLPFVVYAALRGWHDAVVWLMAFNVVINVYPVMLHRYNRNRLRKLLGKLAHRPGRKGSDLEGS